jgi:hypothetical protein
MDDTKKPGLAQADEATKKKVSEMGNAAQGHDVDDGEDMDFEEGDFEQTNMDISGDDDGGSPRGLGKLKEEGQDEKVSRIASMGGSASDGGGRSSQDDEE